MNGLIIMLIAIAVLGAGYLLYGRWLAKSWGIDPSRETPSQDCFDGKDYVPTPPAVVLGHHFASIAGAGTIIGTVKAAAFGWLPALLWIVVGGVFFICGIAGGWILLEKREFEEGVEGIALRREGPGDLLDPVQVFAGAKQAPQGVFVVVRDQGQEGFLEAQTVQLAVFLVEKGVVRALHLRFVLLDVFQKSGQTILIVMTDIALLVVLAEMEQDDRHAEALHLFDRLPVDLFPVFPVDIFPDVQILGGRVVEIPRQLSVRGLFLDLLEDADLVFGPVFVLGLFVVCPKAGQDVAVLVLGAGVMRKIHQGQKC